MLLLLLLLLSLERKSVEQPQGQSNGPCRIRFHLPLKLPINLSITPLNFVFSRDFSVPVKGALLGPFAEGVTGDCSNVEGVSSPFSAEFELRFVVTSLGNFDMLRLKRGRGVVSSQEKGGARREREERKQKRKKKRKRGLNSKPLERYKWQVQIKREEKEYPSNKMPSQAMVLTDAHSSTV